MRTAAIALFGAWYVYELVVSLTRRAALSGARRVELLSLRLIVLAVFAAAVLAALAVRSGIGAVPGDPPLLTAAGLALLLAGIAVRVAAIRTLGRYFTIDVSIAGDHAVVERGLYARVRHPSYLGAILAFLGFGLALGNLLAAALVLACVLPAYVYRMRVEEAALTQALGTAYTDYVRRTARLLPGVY